MVHALKYHSIDIPVALACVNILRPELLSIYVLLNHFCKGGKWTVDYIPLSRATGFPVKRISKAIRSLELQNLIFVERGGKATVSIAEIPDEIIRKWNNIQKEMQRSSTVRKLAKEIAMSTEDILNRI